MDWQIDVALELGIITEVQVTEETQKKLEEFERACVDNYIYARESQVSSYPSRILESEHEEIVHSINSEYARGLNVMREELSTLHRVVDRKNNYIRGLEEQLEKIRRGL